MGCAYSRVNSPPYSSPGSARGGQAAEHGTGTLTARTLNNDVLPAFCKPTMVTSISIALRIIVSMSAQLIRGEPRQGSKARGRRARWQHIAQQAAHRTRLLTKTCALTNCRPSEKVLPCLLSGHRRRLSGRGRSGRVKAGVLIEQELDRPAITAGRMEKNVIRQGWRVFLSKVRKISRSRRGWSRLWRAGCFMAKAILVGVGAQTQGRGW